MNTSQPLVSVVIPMYNVAEYIFSALDSVLTQTYKNLEVICVDDGSPDDSSTIVRSFLDPRIKLIEQQNRGLAGARNTGLYHATGKYVALLDADDLWHKDKIKLHVEHLEQNSDVDISYSPSLFMSESGEKLTIGQFPKLTNITAKDILCRNPVGNGSAPVIRKSLLRKIEQGFQDETRSSVIYFDERLRQSEDIEFWLRCALTYEAKFEGIKQPLTYYRINSAGLSANLENQYNSWKAAISYNFKHHSAFFRRWFTLAKAYQYRYLARRAIQSNMPQAAVFYTTSAIKTNSRILFEEPKRTISTVICTGLMKLNPKIMTWLSERITKPIRYAKS